MGNMHNDIDIEVRTKGTKMCAIYIWKINKLM